MLRVDGDGGAGVGASRGVFGVSMLLLLVLPLGPGNKRLTMDFLRFLFLGGACGGRGTPASASGICSNNSLLDLVSLSSGNCKRGMMRGDDAGGAIAAAEVTTTAEAAAAAASPLLRWLEDV